MLFNSITFVLLHLYCVILYWCLPSQGLRKAVLLVGSIIFYGWYYWPALILLGISMVVNYFFSRIICETEDEKKSGLYLRIAIIVNICSLGWFKYSKFIADNLIALLDKVGIELESPPVSAWLPLGISFYTFQVIGYLVDIRRGEVKAEKDFLTFGVFKCFYAQLVAGPIVRAKELIPQLKEKRVFNPDDFFLGLFYIVAGLAIKICIADTLAQFVEFGFDDPAKLGTATAWTTLYGFAFQILSDFWGYSTVAIGLGLMYGIHLPLNFNLPYIATSLGDFWRRWHITLSGWLRDYIYIPLGGNRNKVYRNLFLTMLIGGLWHGSSWNFVIWGAGHGLWLAVERVFNQSKWRDKIPSNWFTRAIMTLLVFHGVCILWVFFRSPDFPTTVAYFKALFCGPYFQDSAPENLLIILGAFILFMACLGKTLTDRRFLQWSLWRQIGVTLILLLLIISYADARLDFIYFVF